MLRKVVALLMVLVMVGGVVSPAMANKAEPACGNCDGEAGCGEVTLRRMVEVEVLKNGRVILNVTEVNQTLSDWISAKFNESL